MNKAKFNSKNKLALKAIRTNKGKAARDAKRFKEDNLTVAFPNKDMFRNI